MSRVSMKDVVVISQCMDHTGIHVSNPVRRLDIYLYIPQLIQYVKEFGKEIMYDTLFAFITKNIERELVDPNNQTQHKLNESEIMIRKMAAVIERLDPDKMTEAETEIAKELEKDGIIELRTDPVSYMSAWRIKG